jgi:hypothetical protein
VSNSFPTDRPTSAGMYDYFLGGTEHSPADQAAAAEILRLVPEVADAALANRGFLQRAVKRMVTEWGIRQFIDIGSGLPTERNTHDVVAESTPDGRVVYVDIDPTVIERSRRILADVDNTAVILGDARLPDAVLGHTEVRRLIEPDQPIGLQMVAVLHFVPDDDDPWSLMTRYVDTLPTGSALALSHICATDHVPERVQGRVREIYAQTPTPPTDRSRTEIERFFKGTEMVPPYPGATAGLTTVGLWGAEDPETADSDGSRMSLAALGIRR